MSPYSPVCASASQMCPLAFLDAIQDNRGIDAPRVADDLTQRLFDRAGQDLDTRGLIIIGAHQLLDGLERANQRYATARNHALFDHFAARGVQRVFDARLSFHFIFDYSVAAPTLITQQRRRRAWQRAPAWSLSLS